MACRPPKLFLPCCPSVTPPPTVIPAPHRHPIPHRPPSPSFPRKRESIHLTRNDQPRPARRPSAALTSILRPRQRAQTILIQRLKRDIRRPPIRPDGETRRRRNLRRLLVRKIHERIPVEVTQRIGPRPIRTDMQHQRALHVGHHRIADIRIVIAAHISSLGHRRRRRGGRRAVSCQRCRDALTQNALKRRVPRLEPILCNVTIEHQVGKAVGNTLGHAGRECIGQHHDAEIRLRIQRHQASALPG